MNGLWSDFNLMVTATNILSYVLSQNIQKQKSLPNTKMVEIKGWFQKENSKT